MKKITDKTLLEFNDEYEHGDLYGLEYLEKFIDEDLRSLYDKVMNYNYIFGNGFYLSNLFGNHNYDEINENEALHLINKYNLDLEKAKSDKAYNNQLYNDYFVYRNELFDKLGIDFNKIKKLSNEEKEKNI